MTKIISHKNNLKNSHIPVLANEVIKNLNIRDGFTYVDGTYGAGGHTNMILSSAMLFQLIETHQLQYLQIKLKNFFLTIFSL